MCVGLVMIDSCALLTIYLLCEFAFNGWMPIPAMITCYSYLVDRNTLFNSDRKRHASAIVSNDQ
jgi:hypothetical protein